MIFKGSSYEKMRKQIKKPPEKTDKKVKRNLSALDALLGRSWALLGRSRDALGSLFGALEAFLGRSGADLGPILG